jgi:hypothetical protein
VNSHKSALSGRVSSTPFSPGNVLSMRTGKDALRKSTMIKEDDHSDVDSDVERAGPLSPSYPKGPKFPAIREII